MCISEIEILYKQSNVRCHTSNGADIEQFTGEGGAGIGGGMCPVSWLGDILEPSPTILGHKPTDQTISVDKLEQNKEINLLRPH